MLALLLVALFVCRRRRRHAQHDSRNKMDEIDETDMGEAGLQYAMPATPLLDDQPRIVAQPVLTLNESPIGVQHVSSLAVPVAEAPAAREPAPAECFISRPQSRGQAMSDAGLDDEPPPEYSTFHP